MTGALGRQSRQLWCPQLQCSDQVYVSLLCRSSIGSLAGGVFPQCKLCRRPVRSHRCCSWTRLCCPLLYNDWCLGYVSKENCGVSAVAVLTWWSMLLFMQFIDGYGRPCDPAATFGLPLEVPQTQFIARAGGSSSAQRQGAFSEGLEAMRVGHFSRSSGSSRSLSASFRSPRRRRVLCCRSLLPISRSRLWTYTPRSVNVLQKQQQKQHCVNFCQTSAVDIMMDVERDRGAARRRRERRVRSWLKRMIPFPPKFKEEWEGTRSTTPYGDRRRQRPRWLRTARRRPVWPGTRRSFQLYDEEDAVWCARPARLPAVRAGSAAHFGADCRFRSHGTNKNRRTFFVNVSSYNNNFSFRIMNHSTTTIQQQPYDNVNDNDNDNDNGQRTTDNGQQQPPPPPPPPSSLFLFFPSKKERNMEKHKKRQ